MLCNQILLSMFVNVCKCQKMLLSSYYWMNSMSKATREAFTVFSFPLISCIITACYTQDKGITLERMDWTRAQNSATVKLEWSRLKVEEWASVDFQTWHCMIHWWTDRTEWSTMEYSDIMIVCWRMKHWVYNDIMLKDVEYTMTWYSWLVGHSIADWLATV